MKIKELQISKTEEVLLRNDNMYSVNNTSDLFSLTLKTMDINTGNLISGDIVSCDTRYMIKGDISFSLKDNVHVKSAVLLLKKDIGNGRKVNVYNYVGSSIVGDSSFIRMYLK